MVRLVAVDLDGTLLDSNRSISEENVRAVMEARENGVMVVIATGRMHCTAVSATAPIGDDLPIASYNGALLNMTARGPELWRIPVPPSEGGRIARLLFEKGIAFHAYFDDQMYAPRMSQYTAEYEAKYGARSMILEDIDEYGRRESLKYLVLVAPEELDAVEPVVRSVAGESLTVMRSQPGLLEIISSRASKGQALRHLADHFGISISETMAIGDSENDIDMFSTAGIAVAMGNAPEYVKAASGFVTGSNDESGVAMAFRRFGLCGA